ESNNSQQPVKKINTNNLSNRNYPATSNSIHTANSPVTAPQNRDEIHNLDRSSPFILPPEVTASEDTGTQSDLTNTDPSSLENNTNGFNSTGFNFLGKTKSTDRAARKQKQNPLSEAPDRRRIDNIERLIEDLHSPHPATRRKAIWELGQQGDSRALEPLLDLLANSDSNQYSLILASLSEIGIRTLKPMNNAWSISLQNENAQVRKNAIRDLTRVYELVNQISHLLYRAADDPDAEVQETARWSISQLNRILPRSGRE
ncbi:MAG: HEAT repeat domain-containing protein, partial [Microcoleus sp.]